MEAQPHHLRGASAARLLHQAAQNIEAARLLLEDGEGMSSTSREALAAAVQLEALLPTLLTPMTGQRGGRSGDGARSGPDVLWMPAHALVDRVNSRLGLTGVASARVLLYLASHSDRFVPVGELARAIGLRARSTAVIKVYVCRLRKAFVEHGFSAATFETGSGGYMFRRSLHPALTEMLTCLSEQR